ncbi:hypothetical protein [Nannocystis sp. SCPEA4]|uniref:hypothetical protein n=1 Tax=Nannocystis sp. SCPEA4 TaxID=2996787 RepID=UPI002270669D|nr:hypothetical protein [Nannocystis sp. SCPEA4]MCY1055534.1 hypothetical protein [Nannocystis sp. SCPEA4]
MTRLAFVALLSAPLSLSACAIERGKAWGPPVVPDKAVPEVSLVLLGDVGAPGRSGPVVAAELERVLAEHRRRGRPAVVLWLGDNIGPVGPGDLGRCTAPANAWQARGPAALAQVVRAHVDAGGAALAALGEQDWRCGQPELELQAEARGPMPWAMPAHNYSAAVYPDGHVRVTMSCAAGVCVPGPKDMSSETAPLVELVVVDSAAWLVPPPVGTPAAARADHSLAEQAALLAAVTARPAGHPRVLVSHHPLESAGPHGVGGLFSDSGYYLHAPPLRKAVDAGLFAGALSAHDRMVLATADIGPATKRSSRFWLKHPVFQVISGSASAPDSRGGVRGAWYFQSTTLKAELQSNRAGFAELIVRKDSFSAVVRRRKAGRWSAGTLTFPARRPPHPVETTSPVMDPCLYCDPVPPRQ